MTVNVVLSSPGSAAALGSPTSNTLTIHRPPPSLPAPPALLTSDDSGIKGDRVTDVTGPSLAGTTEAGAAVRLLNGLNTVIAQVTAGSDGQYVVLVPDIPLAPGSYKFSIIASNTYGPSPASSVFALSIVAPPPDPGAPTLLPAESDGSAGGETTISTTPSLIGTTIPGASVQLLGIGGTIVTTTTADASGNYQVQVPGPLSVGSYTAKNAVVLRLKSATYTDSTRTVVLIPKKPFGLTKPVQLLINGLSPSGLQDGAGRLIDGNHDGQAGGSAIAILSRSGVKLSAASLGIHLRIILPSARSNGIARYPDVCAAASVHGAGDAEPDRIRRDISPSRGAGRSLHVQDPAALSEGIGCSLRRKHRSRPRPPTACS